MFLREAVIICERLVIAEIRYLKLTLALVTLSENMHKKFEVNQTKIKGGLSAVYISFTSTILK